MGSLAAAVNESSVARGELGLGKAIKKKEVSGGTCILKTYMRWTGNVSQRHGLGVIKGLGNREGEK